MKNEIGLEVKKTPLRCRTCGHEWEYGGQAKRMATCPDCLNKTNVAKSALKK